MRYSNFYFNYCPKIETDIKKSVSILKLSFVKHDKDIYLIDKSFENFRISIHKDGSVWFCPQKEWTNKRKIRLFVFDWNLLEIEPEKEKSIIFYFPSSIEKYPVSDEYKGGRCYIVARSESLHNQFFKLFIINPNITNPKIRETDSGQIGEIIEKKDKDNYMLKQGTHINNPYIKLDKYILRPSFVSINRDNSYLKYRTIINCQPTANIDIHEFFKQCPIVINSEIIEKDGYFISNLTYKDNEMKLIVY